MVSPTYYKGAKKDMASGPIRDPVEDNLLTPQNSAVLIIDYQPVQVNSIGSMDRKLLLENIVRVAKLAKAYGLPTVFTTVNVKTGINKPIIPQLQEVFPGMDPVDRTAINAWEDVDFVKAVKATGRKKLIMCALWTEVCLLFPALDALREGYEVYPVVDAVGGVSVVAHEAALERIAQAGGKYVSWVDLACELQRDWNRKATVPAFQEILFDASSPVYINEHREPVA